MTREEKLMSMRGKDLVQYCLDNDIKVHQSRGILKEARAGVVARILAAESGIPEPEWKEETDNLLEEFRAALKKNPDADAEPYVERLLNLEPEALVYFIENSSGLQNA